MFHISNTYFTMIQATSQYIFRDQPDTNRLQLPLLACFDKIKDGCDGLSFLHLHNRNLLQLTPASLPQPRIIFFGYPKGQSIINSFKFINTCWQWKKTLFGEQQTAFKNVATQILGQTYIEKADHDETRSCYCPSYGCRFSPPS
jgi:hypothetical protein